MPSLKDLKNRIASVKSTQKITKAMKMVAASKLRRAQEAAEAARPYAERMEKVMGALGKNVVQSDGMSPLLVGTGKEETHLVIVATSEKGLCGGFNANIVKGARKKIESLIADGKTVKILCVGRKGAIMLRRVHRNKMLETIELENVKRVGFSEATLVSSAVLDMFAAGEFDIAHLFFAKFQSALVQDVTEQQLIPVPLPDVSDDAEVGLGSAYEYEPSEEAILTDLLPRNVAVQIFKALLENAASEQGARMTAMDNATRNAGDMIDDLTLTYNRTRQAAITTELIEIIAGAEAL